MAAISIQDLAYAIALYPGVVDSDENPAVLEPAIVIGGILFIDAMLGQNFERRFERTSRQDRLPSLSQKEDEQRHWTHARKPSPCGSRTFDEQNGGMNDNRDELNSAAKLSKKAGLPRRRGK